MELQKSSAEAAEPMLYQPVTVHVVRGAEEGSRVHQYLATLAACCGAVTAGCALGWTSPALPLLKGEVEGASSPLGQALNDSQGAWVGALVALGALIGALPGGYAAERFGRRPTLAALSLPFLFAWGLIAVATAPAAIYIARLVIGAATGALSAVAPVYIGEVASAEMRGALGSSFQLMLTIGVLFVYSAGALASFRTLAWLCAIPAAAMLAGVFVFAPESPAYAVAHGDEDTARKSLRRLRGVGADIETPLRELKEAAARTPAAGMSELLATPARKRAVLISLALMLIQQLSGINAIVFYTKDIFKNSGSSLHPDAAVILSGAVMTTSTVVAAALVDRAGRRMLLLVSAAVMALCLFALGICFKVPDSVPGWLALASVAIYIIVFSLGFGPLPWMMLGELFAPEVKSTAGGLAAACNWMTAFVVTFAFQPAVNAVGGYSVIWTFSVICVLATVYVFFQVPETKGKSLQEIQDELGGKSQSAA